MLIDGAIEVFEINNSVRFEALLLHTYVFSFILTNLNSFLIKDIEIVMCNITGKSSKN